jgi:AP-1-like factor
MSNFNTGSFGDAGFDFNGIDWFAQQNGNQFDPQLFGDYREPLDNILSSDLYNDGFNDNLFNDMFAVPDFTSPFNTAPSPTPPKNDKQNGNAEVVPDGDSTKMLSCNTIW